MLKQESLSEMESTAWRNAATKQGGFEAADSCPELLDCSLLTKLVAAALWEYWHRWERDVGAQSLREDAIVVTGEDLADGALDCLHETASDNDRRQVAEAMKELEAADLVLQTGPGRWEIRFGAPFTQEARGENAERRSRARSKAPPEKRQTRRARSRAA